MLLPHFMIRKIDIKALQLIFTGLKKEKECVISEKKKKIPLMQRDLGRAGAWI